MTQNELDQDFRSQDVNRPSEGGSDNNMNVLTFLNQHKFIVVASLVLGLAAGFFYATRQPKVYAAGARIHIDKRDPTRFISTNSVAGVSSDFGYDYIVTQSELLTQETMVKGAVIRGQLETLNSFEDLIAGRDLEKDKLAIQDDVARVIRGTLIVRQAMKDNKPTQILDLYVKGATPNDCVRILSALIVEYEDYHKRNQKSTSREVLSTLFKKESELTAELARINRELTEQRDRDQIISVTTSVDHQRYQALSTTLVALEQELKDAEYVYRSLEEIGKPVLEEEARKQRERAAAPLVPGVPAEMGIPAGMGAPAGVAVPPVDKPLTSEEYNRLLEERRRIRELAENFVSLGAKVQVGELQAKARFDPVKLLEFEQDRETLLNIEREQLTVLGDKHPDVVATRRRLQTIKNKIEQYQQTEVTYHNMVVINLVGAARRRYEDLTKKLTRLEAEVKKAREAALRFSVAAANYENKEYERTKTRNALEAIHESIKGIKVTEDYDTVRITTQQQPASAGQVEPKISRLAAIGAGIGVMLGLGVAFLISMLDNSIRSPEELQELAGAPVMGIVPLIDNSRGVPYPVSGRWVESHSRSSEAEAYRTIRTAIHFGRGTRNARVLLVTSPTQGDGKSTTTANLAASMAQNGLRVLLIEADLRRPVLHKIYDLDPQIGITSALTGNAAVEDVIVRTPLANLDVVPAGPVPPNPAELLSSPEFDRFLRRARETYDRILIDSPPTLLVSDATVLSPRMDATLLVVNGDRATKRSVIESVRNLRTVGGRLAGVIINMVDPREQRYYQYYYYGSYYNHYHGRRGSEDPAASASASSTTLSTVSTSASATSLPSLRLGRGPTNTTSNTQSNGPEAHGRDGGPDDRA